MMGEAGHDGGGGGYVYGGGDDYHYHGSEVPACTYPFLHVHIPMRAPATNGSTITNITDTNTSGAFALHSMSLIYSFKHSLR